MGSALLAFGPLLVRLADTGPIASAFWRMALAAPLLLLVALRFGRRGAPAATLPSTLAAGPFPLGLAVAAGPFPLGLAVAAGAFFAADLAAWHLGIVRTTAANATLFANTTAFMLAGWAILVRGERPSPAVGTALALALAGTLLLLGTSARLSPTHLAGDLLSLLAAAFYTGYLLVVIGLREGRSTMAVLAMATLAGAVLLLPLAVAEALLSDVRFRPRNWWPVIGLALSSQIAGQGLMVFASGRLPAFVVGLGLLVQPLVSALAGWLAFGETLGPLELAGAALILLALIRLRS
jgi:drug/metabolite transporter (DMT)-like permease